MPANRISQIVAGKRDITADTAIRLEIAFGMSAQAWLGLQAHYELDIAKDLKVASKAYDQIERVAA